MSAADLYAQLREETKALEAEEQYQREQEERARQHALDRSQPKPDDMSADVAVLTDSLTSPTRTTDPSSTQSQEPPTLHQTASGGGVVMTTDVQPPATVPGHAEGNYDMAIDETTAKYVATRQRKLLTDDDVIQVAGNLPFVGENITPFMLGYHDDCLVDLLQGVLNRPIESIRIHATSGNRTLMVRCTCPAYQPCNSSPNGEATNASAGVHSDNRVDWVPQKVILVVLKAASLLVPSGTTLTASVYETMHLTCMNHEYLAVRGTSEEAVWRATRLAEQDIEIPLMLGFDSCLHLIIVRNHSTTAFNGYRTSTEILTGANRGGAGRYTGFNGVTEVEKNCEYVVQFDAPKNNGADPSSLASPWGHLQFQFISLPTFEEQVLNKLDADELAKKIKTSSYCRWLWFLTKQCKVNFSTDVPPPVMDDTLIRSIWFALAAVALTDPILEGWSIEAEKEARAALVKPMVIEHNQRLDKFDVDMQRYAQRTFAE